MQWSGGMMLCVLLYIPCWHKRKTHSFLAGEVLQLVNYLLPGHNHTAQADAETHKHKVCAYHNHYHYLYYFFFSIRFICHICLCKIVWTFVITVNTLKRQHLLSVFLTKKSFLLNPAFVIEIYVDFSSTKQIKKSFYI